MKRRNISLLGGLSLLVLSVVLASCSPQYHTATNYNIETECMGVELDGSQTVKAWGKGKDRDDAVEQARKNAVRDVIFKGISKGNNECNFKPLIVEVQAAEKYEDYFFKFFADGGKYAEFVSDADESLFPKIEKDRRGQGSEVQYGVIIRVLRQKLKQKLKQDKILK